MIDYPIYILQIWSNLVHPILWELSIGISSLR